MSMNKNGRLLRTVFCSLLLSSLCADFACQAFQSHAQTLDGTRLSFATIVLSVSASPGMTPAIRSCLCARPPGTPSRRHTDEGPPEPTP
jgi:hypothetical protein